MNVDQSTVKSAVGSRASDQRQRPVVADFNNFEIERVGLAAERVEVNQPRVKRRGILASGERFLRNLLMIRSHRYNPSHFTRSYSAPASQVQIVPMEGSLNGSSSPKPHKWAKVAYGGMQPGFDDNHTDESFLEDMVMNANVVKRGMLKVMLDAVSISQYLCIVALVVLVWTYTLGFSFNENSLLLLDVSLLWLGFCVLLLTAEQLSFSLLLNYFLKISFFITGLYVFSPIYHTLTRSISSDTIWALTASLITIHLFLHNYSGSTVRAPGALENPTFTSNISLNASIVASLLIASRLPSRLDVFAIVLFSLQVFLFAPLVTYCIKKYSFWLHLCFSFCLMAVTLGFVYGLHRLLFVLLLGVLVFVNLVCPYWLIRIQEYKFEINGPWDEAKLCFNITE